MSTTITSLLNSLQSHLQSQTQLLPTLHTQLGLPPTALADDLSTLQRQLAECVESQVNARRAQVEEWMERCDEVQNACVRYGRALGGHVKATGSCVGEIGREGVLPRRFEMITEYQEKLRQLYHTKLEQLLTLTNRIAALSRTLGPDFYSLDILDPVIAEGEDELEPDAHRDVTPERFSKLEKELVRGKAEVGKRLHQLSLTLVQIDYLYSELGITPPSPSSPSTSTSTFNSMLTASSHTNTNGMLTASSNMNNDPFLSSIRASTPTPVTRGKSSLLLSGASTPLYTSEENERDEREYQAIFARFVMRLEELGEDAVTDPSKPSIGLEGIDPSPGLIAWSQRTQSHLSTLKRTNESLIQQTYDLLEPLWRRLSIPDASIDAFVESHRGSTEETVRAYESELERMMEMKRERMGVFVGGAREEIRGLWEELMVGEGERVFAGMDDDEHTEDLLAQHEQEILRLKEERRLKGHLLTHIRKYFDICEEQKELAAAAADTTRLLGRGPRDPGRLLREEKMRRRVGKEKPRLEQDLLASIPAWEAQTGRQFLVHGQPILEIITANIQASNPPHPEKENGKGKSRAGSAPPRSVTSQSNHPPTSNSNSHHPSKARPASSMSMGTSRPGTAQSTSKRKLNESTNSQPSTQRPGLRSASKPSSTSSTTPSLQRAPRSAAPTTHGRSIAATPRQTRSAVGGTGAGGAGGGVGRAPSSTTRRNYHPYPQTHRGMATRSATKSNTSTSTSNFTSNYNTASSTGGFAVMGSMALNSRGGMGGGMGAERKVVQRTKRESFKPRASVDVWDLPPVPLGGGEGVGGGQREMRWAGFAGVGVGVVKEEEFEDDF